MAEEGLDINFEAVDGSSAVYQARSPARPRSGCRGPAPPSRHGDAARSRSCSTTTSPSRCSVYVVPEASGIKDVAELKGKVIGVGTAEGSEVAYARAILSDAGMQEKTDYTFLPVGDGGMAVAAIERGDIAAYSAAIPDMAIMTARGLALKEITPEKFLAYFGNGYATMTETLQKDPELIAAFTRAIMKGTWFAEQNKAKTLEHCAKLNPEEGADTALSSALFDAVLPRTHPLGGVALGEFTQAGWEAWQASLIGAGDLTSPAASRDVDQHGCAGSPHGSRQVAMAIPSVSSPSRTGGDARPATSRSSASAPSPRRTRRRGERPRSGRFRPVPRPVREHHWPERVWQVHPAQGVPRALAGDDGEVMLRGTPVVGPRRDIGIMFQQATLLPWRTTLKNVLLPIEIRDGAAAAKARTPDAMALLEMVGLTGFESVYPHELSGGMAQRAAICKRSSPIPRCCCWTSPSGPSTS